MNIDKYLTNTFPGFISVRDINHKIVFLNDNFKNWIRLYTPIDPIGKTNYELAEIVPKNVANTFLQCHDASVNLQKNTATCSNGLKKVIEFHSDDENPRSSMYFDVLKYSVVMDGESYIFTIAYDITDLYIENIYNQYISITDPMTDVYNRRYFELNTDLIYGHYCAVFNIDKFKILNDEEGHFYGDLILKEFGLFLKQIEDVIAVIRLGGDKFMTIFINGIDKQKIKNRILEKRALYEKRYAQYQYLSFSFGIGIVESGLEKTIKLIDQKMYQDKK